MTWLARNNKGPAQIDSGCYFVAALVLSIILSLLPCLGSSPVYAKTIWRIGHENDEEPNEFKSVGTNIYAYQIPQDWEITNDWTLFPKYLAPPGLGIPPTEIRLNFAYSRDYRAPLLKIRASSYGANYTQRLLVSKGEQQQSAYMLSSFYTSEFYLSPIKAGGGDNNQNTIILKNESLSGDNFRIYFDYLELDDQDEDGDNSLDYEELYGDPNRDTDGDGLKDHQDADCAAIFLPNPDKESGVIVIMDLLEKDDFRPYFREVALIDQNSPDFPKSLPPTNLMFYYDLFRAKIQIPKVQQRPDLEIPSQINDPLSIRFIYPEKIYPLARFFIYDNAYNNDKLDPWKEVPIKAIDENSVMVSISSQYTNQGGEILVIGGLAYPTDLDISLKEKGCFISIY